MNTRQPKNRKHRFLRMPGLFPSEIFLAGVSPAATFTTPT